MRLLIICRRPTRHLHAPGIHPHSGMLCQTFFWRAGRLTFFNTQEVVRQMFHPVFNTHLVLVAISISVSLDDRHDNSIAKDLKPHGKTIIDEFVRLLLNRRAQYVKSKREFDDAETMIETSQRQFETQPRRHQAAEVSLKQPKICPAFESSMKILRAKQTNWKASRASRLTLSKQQDFGKCPIVTDMSLTTATPRKPNLMSCSSLSNRRASSAHLICCKERSDHVQRGMAAGSRPLLLHGHRSMHKDPH